VTKLPDVLSQKEIDELLKALNTGAIKTEDVETKERKIKKYDFRRPNKFSKEQLKTMQMIFDNFVRSLNTFLSGYLRTLVQIEVISVEQLTYYEFMNSIVNPAFLAIISMEPLPGSCVLEIYSTTTYALIDRILGGGFSNYTYKSRNFTEIELSIMERVVFQILPILKESWENIIPINPKVEKIETNSQFAQIVSPNETVALITININIGNIQGMMNFCIPHMVIEPILPKLSTRYWFATNTGKRSDTEIKIIQKKIENSTSEIRVILGKTFLPVKDILDLNVGDVIQLETSVKDNIQILVGNRLKFYGKPGYKNNKLAVKIVSTVDRGDDLSE